MIVFYVLAIIFIIKYRYELGDLVTRAMKKKPELELKDFDGIYEPPKD